MMEKIFDPDAVINALAPLVELSVGDASRAQVRAHLEIAAEHAERLMAFPLEDEAEPAPVFTP